MKTREMLLGMQTELFDDLIGEHGRKIDFLKDDEKVRVQSIDVQGSVSNVTLKITAREWDENLDWGME